MMSARKMLVDLLPRVLFFRLFSGPQISLDFCFLPSFIDTDYFSSA